jgi:hypothetical protein
MEHLVLYKCSNKQTEYSKKLVRIKRLFNPTRHELGQLPCCPDNDVHKNCNLSKLEHLLKETSNVIHDTCSQHPRMKQVDRRGDESSADQQGHYFPIHHIERLTVNEKEPRKETRSVAK